MMAKILNGGRPRMLCMITVCMVLAGCNPNVSIVKHRVPKERSGLDELRSKLDSLGDVTASPNAAATEKRMVVAIFERPDASWFFKLTGPVDRVNQSMAECESLFSSVKFGEDGTPTWTTPKGWSDGPKSSMRLATLFVDEEQPPVEMSIMNLGPNQDLLLNANRWLGQLNIPPVDKDNLDKVLTKSGDYYLFDATGTGSGSMASPPFAPFAQGMSPQGMNPQGNLVDRPVASGAAKMVTYAAPDGWEELPNSQMVQAKLKLTQEDQVAEISIVRMPASANEWEPNAMRWAGQVEQVVSGEKLSELTESVEVDGQKGQMIRLIEDSKDKAIVAAMITENQNAWFIKLMGDRALVQEHTDSFLNFMKSVRFQSK